MPRLAAHPPGERHSQYAALTLLKIDTVIVCNKRRIRILLSSACPHQDLFRSVALRLNTS